MSTSQSRRMSFIEVCVGTTIGFLVAVITTAIVFPLFGLYASLPENIAITMIFTIVSIIRGYFVRRVFEVLR